MIVFAGEQRLRLEFAEIALQGRQLTVNLFQKIVALLGVGFFLGEIDVGINITRKRSELGIGADLILGALAVPKNSLRRFLIAPEIRLGDARFQGLQALAMLRGVKENSVPA
jgi:hypothetical protein